MDKDIFKQLDTSLAGIETKIASGKTILKQLAAKKDKTDETKEEMMEMMGSLYGYMQDIASNLRKSVCATQDALYSHSSAGHLPALSPGQMKKMLENCGAHEDYEVAKRVIYASRANALEIRYEK